MTTTRIPKVFADPYTGYVPSAGATGWLSTGW